LGSHVTFGASFGASFLGGLENGALSEEGVKLSYSEFLEK
jgi:hypothetical protein